MSGYPYSTQAAMPRALRADRRSDLSGPLSLVGLCLAALALVWAVAEFVPAAHIRDAVLLHHFVMLDNPRLDRLAELLPNLLNPPLFVIWGIALVLIAVARERPRVAVAVVVVMALAPLSSELLKPLLAHSHVRIGWTQIGPASFPSGHSTAAAALALSAVLVSPARLRPLVSAFAVVFTLAVGASLLIGAWHMPSDVLGGYLVAVAWTALAVAGVRASRRRWPPRAVGS